MSYRTLPPAILLLAVACHPAWNGDGDNDSFFRHAPPGGVSSSRTPARRIGGPNTLTNVFVPNLTAFGFTSLCSPDLGGVIGCPCSNPPGGSDKGCDNSAGTGGAILTAFGGTSLSSDSLEFRVAGEPTEALSTLMQGTAAIPTGAVYGQGVRCVGGTLIRLGTKHASGGSMTIPDFEAGDPQVTAISAAKGDPIQPGDSRYYLVYYRDPTVLGGCPASSTFNCTQTGMVTWSP